jgi:5-methylcytosine-specific restriction endonuclease McrA
MQGARSLEEIQLALDKLNSRKYRAHKERVFLRDGRICRYCGSDENLQIDHIISRKRGGTHDLENLQVLCRNCNLRKSSKEEGVFLAGRATPPVFSSFLSPTRSEIAKDSPFTARPVQD